MNKKDQTIEKLVSYIEILETKIAQMEFEASMRYQEPLGVLHGKPHTEITKLKKFMEVFNLLSGAEKEDVEHPAFVNELINSEEFNKNEAEIYIKKAMQNGQIYERRQGIYAKA